mmetsp:Transcript_33673/g.112409  ORF Transcript_33673/g.112409 Transcript_33673/m.112409 type:complete len:253 (-) Transcript_33673:846-1604(-)
MTSAPVSCNRQATWTPSAGSHVSTGDAVFSMAVEVTASNFFIFVRSLRQSGYKQDVVLVTDTKLPRGVADFLDSDGRTVRYATQWSCVGRQGARTPADQRSRPNDLCVSDRLYGTAAKDTRSPRQRAFIRFEIYWSWLCHYAAQSRIFMLDFRDVFFQVDPFASLPAQQEDPTWLYLFAEYHSIANSSFNRRWISSCYGPRALTASLASSAVVCSGSTAGAAAAIGRYLEVMVAQYDRTKCTLHGSDQGFHE